VRTRTERGSALIFVLYLLITLGVLAAEVARGTRAESARVAVARARSVGRYAAESGIAAATVRIHGLLDSAMVAPTQLAPFPRLNAAVAAIGDAPLGGGRFQVALVNLNARLDLNRASEVILQEFLTQFTSRRRAEIAVAALRKEPIRRVGELVRIPGVDQALAFAVAPYVTVWGDDMIDVNAAPESVLAAVPGLGEAGARALVQRREAGEVFTFNDIVRPRAPSGKESEDAGGTSAAVPIPQLVTAPSRLLLISRGWYEGHPATHEIQAVYTLLGQRLVLQAWWERDL
jgi:type II secretory pathway component PulK